MSQKPVLVSVVVPTADRPGPLREALASVRALEGPDLKFEILVGDNGKDTATKAVCDEFGAIYTKVERRGCAAARNGGMRKATGEFVAFIDDDDVWLPTNIRPHIQMMRERPNLEAAFGRIVSTDMNLKPLMAPWPENPGEGDKLVESLLMGYYPQVAGTVIRTSLLKEIGYFDEDLLGDQDWDWQLRFVRRRNVGFTPTSCVLFRQRPPGSFDKLRLTRLRFARKVFFHHAPQEWKTLRGFSGFTRAYMLILWQYFEYFRDAAEVRARNGDRKGSAAAIMGAFKTFPFRTMWHLVAHKELRSAAWCVIRPLPHNKPRMEGA